MQPRQTPKWLSLFITAFGPNGLVALAWWLGALHAERIRSAQRSYPFLEVTGAAGSGKSTLLSVLWKLIGFEPTIAINLAHSTRAAVLRRVYSAANLPVLIDDTERQAVNQERDRLDMEDEGGTTPFDWNELKACFTGEAASFLRGGAPLEEAKFRGALVITANPPVSEAMRSRFVIIEIHHSQRTGESAQALRDLLDMLSTGSTGDLDFYETAKAAGARLEGLLQHTTAYYASGEPHHSQRVTFNHAQLHALLGVLDDLFVLPTDAREDAHIEVAAMCLITD
ncbi:hypothetical protein L5T15_000950 [Pseudomonas aeruginosa]|uniref:hypothetical protein n=1 Tax=Pseudomonas aeruginosa TaxID=287 RepID=UPI001CF0618E|nr:hypothetical protein [Pseudomonas aeruginosa]EIU1420718.1 hypothetical protein [Pseudomonas aeruginosa]EKU3791499.1 hypothetical protein [Pseudomonas aeruginosa]EKV3157765.1 hypothetical protein [Pseudomonas aeruginosa]EKX0258277.1 hypothetical protein [Pseudomonas aeruginosa]MDQ4185303.1 hypothetical protein [Pseudomonas aeruginosa]